MKKLLILTALVSVIFLANSAHAVLGVGARGGVDIFKDDPPGTGAMFGAQLRMDVPLTDFSAEISGEYFSKSYNKKNETSIYEQTLSMISVNGTLKYDMGLLPLSPIDPYLGAGIGMHVMAYEIEAEGQTVIVPDDETKFGIHGLVGTNIKMPTMPFGFFIEARYTSIFTEEENTNMSSVYGGLNFGF